MYIIDKHKDYYDYLSHIYGEDRVITFDRRGSTKIEDGDIYSMLKEFRYYSYNPKTSFIILEIGSVQYLIHLFNFRYRKDSFDDEQFKSLSMKLIYTFKNNQHYFKYPISIVEVEVKTIYSWKKKVQYVVNDNFKDVITKIYKEKLIKLPILADTKITSLIPPEEVWKELQNYIASLKNDKDVDILMTDVQRAETHGFDKVTSFRNPIK